MADTQTQRVLTRHSGANEAIAALRKIAADVKKLGDDNLALHGERDKLLNDLDGVQISLDQAGQDASSLREAIIDFDRGIIDQAELVKLALGDPR